MKKAKFKVNQIISFLDEQNSDQEKRGVIEASNYLLSITGRKGKQVEY